jgi:hypothetical protein
MRHHLDILATGFVCGLVLSGSILLIQHGRSKHNRRWQKQKRELVDKLAQRRFLSYGQSVVFGAEGEVVQWKFELELEYAGDEGELESVPHALWYDGGKGVIDITPINDTSHPQRIDIEDVFVGHDSKYNFMVKFTPALKPHMKRTYAYQATPRRVASRTQPYLAAIWRTHHGYDTTKFFVQFHKEMLPRNQQVHQVYWSPSVGENGKGYKMLNNLPLNKANNYSAQVSFSRDQIEALPGEWEHRHYGLVWEWDTP